ncbi:small-subunit processome [Crassisporium funariophilum]|nr:small-subunit processome [Crassisporium funariophilum]
MTSSLRNSIHRRNHKERSQLAHRSKLGLLEKHSDYVKRARDYHSKQDRLTRLKQKVAERNKDEFYFSMSKERTKGGVHIKSRDNVALPTDIVKVLKTQDENYVRTMRASGLKKIDKIKNQLMETVDLDLSSSAAKSDDDNGMLKHELETLKEANIIKNNTRQQQRRHIVFAESPEEVSSLSNKGKRKEIHQDSDLSSPQPAETNADLGWKSTTLKSKSKIAPASILSADVSSQENATEVTEKRRRLLKELSARLGRDQQLRYAEREFEMQRQLMGKGARKKILGVEKVEGQDEDEEDQDEIDARKGRRRPSARKVDEATYRPRVYKWRLERKR